MKLNILTALVIGICLMITTSCEPDRYAYDDWDADNNDLIDNDEFTNTWDQLGYYDNWDTDADGTLTEDEWQTGIGDYYAGYDYNENRFEDWDRNADGILDEDEFRDGNYSVWDTNRDGNIQDTEYEEWY